jgi:hypothetical protein
MNNMNNVESTMFGKLLTYVSDPRIIYSVSVTIFYNYNFIIRYPSLAYRNTMDLQVKNIILNYIYNL